MPEAILTAPPRVAFFGKLPAHGDFVARGLTPLERDALDRWLTELVLRVPPLPGIGLFVSGRDEARFWCAAICPSRDRAGRRFPATIRFEDTRPWGFHRIQSVLEAARDQIASAVAEEWNVDVISLDPPVADGSEPEGEPLPPGICAWADGGDVFHAETGDEAIDAVASAISSGGRSGP